jgi:hypothetical protein
MRIVLIAASILIALATTSTTVTAATLTEQQARLKAAEWIREHGISADRSKAGPATDKTVFEILGHIRDGLLAVRGTTSYCGKIRKRTWIIVFDQETRSWNGGNPVLIDARTGKVLDCRS